MGRVTYYVVLPFFRTSDGELLADEPIEVSDADRARRQAERVARSKAGAVAFSRTGDPVTGEFADAVVWGMGRANRTGRILFQGGAGPDHPVHPLLPESAYLKALLFQLG